MHCTLIRFTSTFIFRHHSHQKHLAQAHIPKTVYILNWTFGFKHQHPVFRQRLHELLFHLSALKSKQLVLFCIIIRKTGWARLLLISLVKGTFNCNHRHESHFFQIITQITQQIMARGKKEKKNAWKQSFASVPVCLASFCHHVLKEAWAAVGQSSEVYLRKKKKTQQSQCALTYSSKATQQRTHAG